MKLNKNECSLSINYCEMPYLFVFSHPRNLHCERLSVRHKTWWVYKLTLCSSHYYKWYFVHNITVNIAVCLQIKTKGQTFLAFEERINLRTSHLVGLLFLSHFSRSQKYAVMNCSNSRVSKATSSRGGGEGNYLVDQTIFTFCYQSSI